MASSSHPIQPNRTPLVTKFVAQSPKRPKDPLPLPQIAPFIIKTQEGRDSALRLLQYSLRLSLYLRQKRLSSPLFTRLLALVSLLSATRRFISLVQISNAILHFWSTYKPLRSLFVGVKQKTAEELRREAKGKSREIPPLDLATPPPSARRWDLLILLHWIRESLDLLATLSDNLYLFHQLHLLPFLSPRVARKSDRLSDFATLLSSSIGLLQVYHSISEIWIEGRGIRKGVLALEERLEECVALEVQAEGEGKEGNEEKIKLVREMEKGWKERIRGERRRLRRLRDELNELWWERLRLGAEGIFAAVDVLEVQTGSEFIRAFSGITSSSILMAQSWWDYTRQ